MSVTGYIHIHSPFNRSKGEGFPIPRADHVSVFQVTSLLLEAERRKLSVLQRELQVALAEGGSIKAKEHQKQELIIAIS